MTLKKGSKGNDVSTLQTLLNNNGYNLAVDGSYGSKTEAAVRDYQTKNGLTVDGIAGTQTLGALNGSGSATSSATQTKSTAQILADLEANQPTYTPSDAVTQALNSWNSAEEKYNAYGAYEGKYDTQIQGLIDQIANREDFSYDYSKDPLYDTYKDQYTNQARLAMKDAMGEAASLTGGYGSSAAQTVGQQQYQNTMSGLNDVALSLYDRAYQKYEDEGTALYNQLSMYNAQDQADYQKYADQLDKLYNDLQYYQSKYGTLSDEDYNKYLTNLEQWNSDRTYYYNKNLDEIAAAAASASSGGSGGGGGSKKSNYTANYGVNNSDALKNQSGLANTGGDMYNQVADRAYYYVNKGDKPSAIQYLSRQVVEGNITKAQKTAIWNAINGK